jgi:hypothetical protein
MGSVEEVIAEMTAETRRAMVHRVHFKSIEEAERLGPARSVRMFFYGNHYVPLTLRGDRVFLTSEMAGAMMLEMLKVTESNSLPDDIKYLIRRLDAILEHRSDFYTVNGLAAIQLHMLPYRYQTLPWISERANGALQTLICVIHRMLLWANCLKAGFDLGTLGRDAPLTLEPIDEEQEVDDDE